MIAFLPVVSAVAGNVGLQSSNINTRALACGLYRPDETGRAVMHELRCGVWCAFIMSCTMAVVSGGWFTATLHTGSTEGKLMHGLGFGMVVGVAQFFSILSSVLTGASAPLLFKRLGRDPATLAGPMETSIQDVLGYGTFMLLGHFLLPLIEPSST
eukprot:TRINITY_DN12777_c0_g1_i2.p1 TRINITY_DN12777_c0_g1~~TRINITY_DN12777_c0_g1_i2.p1  ORF type:complete len:156 (-),score=23.54 TRINITY_DN12777_c0_g1_i2:223-690(-)